MEDVHHPQAPRAGAEDADQQREPLYRSWANLWNANWWYIDGLWVNRQGYFWTRNSWDMHRALRRQELLTEELQEQQGPPEEVLQ